MYTKLLLEEIYEYIHSVSRVSVSPCKCVCTRIPVLARVCTCVYMYICMCMYVFVTGSVFAFSGVVMLFVEMWKFYNNINNNIYLTISITNASCLT